ncbi:hypothetical protein CYANOKiyG1_27520 [Okeania sp. KiyG1]|nr:hypothetical protein CYANOKiyG1_27520 [Okeania sp. KiyG1]
MLQIDTLDSISDLEEETLDAFFPDDFVWKDYNARSIPADYLTIRERSTIYCRKDDKYFFITDTSYLGNFVWVIFSDHPMFPIFQSIGRLLNVQLKKTDVKILLDSEQWAGWIKLVNENPKLSLEMAFRKLLTSKSLDLLSKHL